MLYDDNRGNKNLLKELQFGGSILEKIMNGKKIKYKLRRNRFKCIK